MFNLSNVRRVTFASATVLLSAGSALAQADYCGQLRAQLAATGGRDGGAGNIQALYRELAMAQGQANAYGCRQGFFFFGGGGGGPQCSAILNRVNSLQSTISNLQRSSFFGGGGEYAAGRIRQEMASAGCAAGGFGVGQGRTLCVRVCDGYYFPISFSTDRSRFKRDEAACQAMYPPGQAALFVDGDADGDSDDMVSLDGKRYSAQPYALAYRSTYNASCPPPRPVASGISAGVVPPIPVAKPKRGEDPDTAANRAGDFVPTVVTAPDQQVAGDNAPDAKPVRMVGPSYFYAGTDFAVPAPKTAENPPQPSISAGPTRVSNAQMEPADRPSVQ